MNPHAYDCTKTITLPKRRLLTSMFTAETDIAFKQKTWKAHSRKHWRTCLNFHPIKYNPMQCFHLTIIIRSGLRFTLGYAFICVWVFFNSLKGKKNIHSISLSISPIQQCAFNTGREECLQVTIQSKCLHRLSMQEWKEADTSSTPLPSSLPYHNLCIDTHFQLNTHTQ